MANRYGTAAALDAAETSADELAVAIMAAQSEILGAGEHPSSISKDPAVRLLAAKLAAVTRVADMGQSDQTLFLRLSNICEERALGDSYRFQHAVLAQGGAGNVGALAAFVGLAWEEASRDGDDPDRDAAVALLAHQMAQATDVLHLDASQRQALRAHCLSCVMRQAAATQLAEMTSHNT